MSELPKKHLNSTIKIPFKNLGMILSRFPMYCPALRYIPLFISLRYRILLATLSWIYLIVIYMKKSLFYCLLLTFRLRMLHGFPLNILGGFGNNHKNREKLGFLKKLSSIKKKKLHILPALTLFTQLFRKPLRLQRCCSFRSIKYENALNKENWAFLRF